MPVLGDPQGSPTSKPQSPSPELTPWLCRNSMIALICIPSCQAVAIRSLAWGRSHRPIPSRRVGKRDFLAVWTMGGALCAIGPYLSTIDRSGQGRAYFQNVRKPDYSDGAGKPVHPGQRDPRHWLCHGGPDRPKRRHPHIATKVRRLVKESVALLTSREVRRHSAGNQGSKIVP